MDTDINIYIDIDNDTNKGPMNKQTKKNDNKKDQWEKKRSMRLAITKNKDKRQALIGIDIRAKAYREIPEKRKIPEKGTERMKPNTEARPGTK